MSCTYSFEKSLDIGGVLTGEFAGTAELVRDGRYGFRVASITLDGDRKVGRWIERAKVTITHDKGHPMEREIFRSLAEQIENSPHAIQFFEAEMEAA